MPETFSPLFAGEMAALSAAILWSFASLLFDRAGKMIRPIEMTLWKGVLASLLLLAAIWLRGEIFSAISLQAMLLLALSGVIGISIGDTAFFESLTRLGARKALLLGALAPPTTALIALFTLNEQLPPSAWVGIIITVAGIAWVIGERSTSDDAHRVTLRGVLFGIIATLSQATGVVFSRAALTLTAVTPLQSALFRLTAGSLALLVGLAFSRQKLLAWKKDPQAGTTVQNLFWATFIGTFLCMWLQQFALSSAPAGITQTLLSTSPLFILPIALATGEKLNARAILGAVAALAGILLLFW